MFYTLPGHGDICLKDQRIMMTESDLLNDGCPLKVMNGFLTELGVYVIRS